MEKPNFEFWFEFASTYSYLSVSRIDEISKTHGVSVEWKPFLLGPIFKSQGWDTSPFNIYKAKGDYMWKDIERICEKYNIAFTKPSVFPQNGLLAARIALAYENESWVSEFTKRVFSANFTEDKDISDQGVLEPILSSFELEPDQIIARAKSQENKDALRERTELAVSKGIFGAPTFAIEGEIFWGND
ncbi:MAG: 2-hydroxychromene-2-carboxylate isomerase, partial [Thermodesulfobacteriota bacterium]